VLVQAVKLSDTILRTVTRMRRVFIFGERAGAVSVTRGLFIIGERACAECMPGERAQAVLLVIYTGQS